jgi:hypothetical protein
MVALPVENEYQNIWFPLRGARKRRSVPTPHSPRESTFPSHQEGSHMAGTPEGSLGDGNS